MLSHHMVTQIEHVDTTTDQIGWCTPKKLRKIKRFVHVRIFWLSVPKRVRVYGYFGAKARGLLYYVAVYQNHAWRKRIICVNIDQIMHRFAHHP